jgi:predicted nucleic acid-binding protein
MKIYLDNCALQRPLDDQSYLRIRLEAEAVVEIIELVEAGDLVLLNSAVLEYELQKCADLGRVEYGMEVLSLASDRIRLSDRMVRRAKRFQGLGMEGIDVLHLAVAEANNADFLCTCDDPFWRRARNLKETDVRIVSPTELIEELERNESD